MATSNLLDTVGSTIKWLSTGGSGVITFSSIANAAGRLGDRVDLGAILASGPAARATYYRWYVTTQCQASGLALGNTLDLYFAGWNDDTTPANPDGNVGASDAGFSNVAALPNLHPAGSVFVDSTSGATVFASSGYIWLPYRYVSPVLWNNSGALSSATASVTQIWLTPDNLQSQ